MDTPQEQQGGATVPVATALSTGNFASADTLNSSVAFLRNTLAGLGFCQDLNLLSTEPSDIVETCNMVYGLLLQHQKDSKFKEQLKNEMHRMRMDMQRLEKERAQAHSRLQAKEREIGNMFNKQQASSEAGKKEVAAAKKEVEDLSKKLTGMERRVVQLQHEIKRKENEYARLQEKLTHYLADKKKHEKTVLEMAGKVTAQLAASQASRKTDEGLKAVVMAYEQKQGELQKENEDLKASLASLQQEYKDLVNKQIRAAKEESAAAKTSSVVEDSFMKAIAAMNENELRAEMNIRIRQLHNRLQSIAQPAEEARSSPEKKRLASDLALAQQVVHEQEKLLEVMLDALRNGQQAKEAQHATDLKRVAQHYQAQLAAAEEEIKKAKAAAEAAGGPDKEALQAQVESLQAALESERAAAAAAADSVSAQMESERAKMAASLQQERVALQLQAQEVFDSQRRFEVLQRNYQDLMRKWAPGVGAGLFLERAISRKAVEMTAAEVGEVPGANALGAGAGGTIPAARPVVSITVDARA